MAGIRHLADTRSDSDNALAHRSDRRSTARWNIELLQDAGDMRLHGSLGNEELPGNLGIRLAFDKQTQDIDLPCGQPVCSAGFVPASFNCLKS